MDTYKLKMKIGVNEFEAEGAAATVQAQFEAFRDLVQGAAAAAQAPPAAVLPAAIPDPATAAAAQRAVITELMLDKIMRFEGRVVSLTVRGKTVDDELMLLMLGQRHLRKNESVSGAELIEGLRVTGRNIARVDYRLDRLTEAGLLITTGQKRGRRYRMTNQGASKAQEIAFGLIEQVA